jgi:hypothetical protein
METISAKQVEGAVDVTSDQSIGGEKSFTSPANFFPTDPGQFECLRIEGLYLYWLKDRSKFENDGNMRIGPSMSYSCPTLQEFKDGSWKERNPNDII